MGEERWRRTGMGIAVLLLAAASCGIPRAERRSPGPPGTVVESPGVPPDFAPVRFDGAAGVVSVWGREYHFADGPLPSQVVALGQSLFSEPPTLRVRAGGRDQ